MPCPQCGQTNPAGTRFCGHCGTRLPARCGACGAENPSGNRFCGQCGEPFAGAATATREREPLGAGEEPAVYTARRPTYTPRHLAEKILTSKSALEGERKHVTVLFVDIVESSRLAEQLDPEAMHEIMDRILRLMTQVVHRYEGTVNQFLGDGLMALFGAPLALEDHAVRAVHAALGIRETVRGLSEQFRRERGVDVRLRLGLNSGTVIVGRIGDDLRMDYTAIGDTTHLASRMQTLAEPDTILVTDATHQLVEGHVETESIGKVQVKGRSGPVDAFRVTGRRRRRTRLEVRAAAGLTPLVGREREHATLRDCLADAVAGRGQVVGIVGEPGLGKSRLLYEFHRSIADVRMTWFEAHCSPDAQATPYTPVLEILGAGFQIEDGDNAPQIEEKLRQGLQRLGSGLDTLLPFLREPFGLPGEDDRLQHLTAREKRQKTFEALRALTMTGSQQRPHVIVVEDLHWIDRTSEDYLAFLVESLPAVPVLLVTAHRPGYALRWTQKTYYTQIALGQLDESEVEAMLARVLGTRDVPADLARRIQEKAEGNPLFVEEITRSLRERGLLVRRDGGFVWARHADVDVPRTVQDIVRARLDRLEEPVKRTVQAAAAIGRRFGVHVLSRVAADEAEVEASLATLTRLELVHEARFFPETEYAFTHAVIQDTAYQGLLGQRRRALHGAIAAALEDVYAERLEDHAALLAYHWARSDEPGRAIGHALTAGDRAARVCANAEATTHYQQALDVARALPASRETRGREIDAVLKLATVGATREDMQRDRANLAAARLLAAEIGDPARDAQIAYWSGRVEYVLGNPGDAIAHAEASLRIAEKLVDDALAAPPVNLLGRLHWQQGALGEAAVLLERSTEQMLRLGNMVDAATTAGFAGIALADGGEFERAIARADQGVELADTTGNPFARAAVRYFRGHVRQDRGEWQRAIDDFGEGRAIAEAAGDRFRVYTIKVYEGRAHTMLGGAARGRVILEECLAIAEQLGTRLFLSRPKAFLAEALLALGELDAAAVAGEEALQVAQDTGERHGEALARRALAQACLRRHPADPRRAEELIRAALAIQEASGERPELARTRVVYADLLATRGDRQQAAEILVAAAAMFREMGMAWDLARLA